VEGDRKRGAWGGVREEEKGRSEGGPAEDRAWMIVSSPVPRGTRATTNPPRGKATLPTSLLLMPVDNAPVDATMKAWEMSRMRLLALVGDEVLVSWVFEAQVTEIKPVKRGEGRASMQPGRLVLNTRDAAPGQSLGNVRGGISRVPADDRGDVEKTFSGGIERELGINGHENAGEACITGALDIVGEEEEEEEEEEGIIESHAGMSMSVTLPGSLKEVGVKVVMTGGGDSNKDALGHTVEGGPV